MRAYKVPEKMDGKSVAEIETEFSPERVFVERVKNAEGVFDAEPDLRLHAENLIVLSGRPRMLGGASNPPQSTEVEESQLLDIPPWWSITFWSGRTWCIERRLRLLRCWNGMW